MLENMENPFGPGTLFAIGGYQLMHPGMPGAIHRKSITNAATYGLRGWRGLTFGLSTFATSPIARGAEAISKRTSWKGYRHIHGATNFLHQLFSGGSGDQRQITLLGGKTFLGPHALSAGETAVAKTLVRKGLMGSVGSYQTLLQMQGAKLGLAESLAASVGIAGPAQRTLQNNVLRAVSVGAGAEAYGAMGGATGQHIANLGSVFGNNQMDKAVSRGTAWKLGSARVLSAAAPFFGLLNTFFVADLAFKAGQFGGQLVGASATALRETNRSIRRLDLGGSTAAFQTGGAITERQRAVQAIQMNHLNARQAIGQEAGYMHG